MTTYQVLSNGLSLAKTAFNRFSANQPSPIGYIGWLGHRNLGDEAMFEAAKRLFDGHPLVNYSGARKEKVLSAVGLSGNRYFSRVILGGGTLINSGYSATVRTALESGLDLMTLGTGAGSNGFSNDRVVDIREWAPLLKRFKRVGVRGPRSLRALEQLGVGTAEVVGDLALALTEEKPREIAADAYYALNAAVPGADAPDFPTQFVLDELRLTVKRLAQIGLRPIPVAFCAQDVAPTKYVAGNFGESSIPVVARHDEFFNLVGPCRFLVGVRLHSAVLSSCVGVPSLLVAYRDKGADFMESISMQNWLVDPYTAKCGELSDKALLLATNASELRNVTLNHALQYRNRLKAYVNHI